MSSNFSDRVVVVSGGTKGLGRALAEGFLEKGFRVALCGRAPGEAAASLASQGIPADRIQLEQCDVGKELDCERFIGAVLANFKRIDVLINNASILGKRTLIEALPSSLWNEVMRTNLDGVFFLSKAVLPFMKSEKSGSIINISSSVGRTGRKTWGAYAVSKSGVEGLTEVMADELTPFGVTVNSVNPGAIATDMRAAAFPAEDPATLKQPSDILDVFYYLASSEARKVTGRRFDAQEFTRPEMES